MHGWSYCNIDLDKICFCSYHNTLPNIFTDLYPNPTKLQIECLFGY